ncbi:putative pachytene checkpoint component Pch2 [Aspergillus vadensis CBS 113365]|uniref:Pachytene checkpoint component Pch2 n=1 Tax=Aspergillus vadensis (strain CBS 113365 / IMI 142717 / IBT 24658) TaxID=1448311 RepID=A0A319B015_ASPVC|nr:pachytene checkpoint component Pch2 [Aspergillus vadensis CBS 113365]PYH65415.1 pachytene checkpoint component Pch2 [Aspergillus vadensis CBS 113365]
MDLSVNSCVSNPVEESQRPILHIEARVKCASDGMIVRTDLVRDEVTEWLHNNFIVMSVDQFINSFGGLSEPHAQALEFKLVTECSGGNLESGAYRLQDVQLDVQVYQLRTKSERQSLQKTSALEDSTEAGGGVATARVLALPSIDLEGLWETLDYDQPIQSTLLSATSRMVSFSAHKLDKWTINWNRLILIWGPPGTGKTSLCRGLAQKLAIRLGKDYPQSKLFEINAYSLGSKYFGESSKLVNGIFGNIETFLQEEEDTFVCVFMDEIETLVARRDRALSSNEPFDAIRAVDAVLTGLDKLKEHSNVIVVCTSNLITALDCLEELSQSGLIEGVAFDVVQVTPDDPQTALQYVEQAAEHLTIPTFDEVLLHYRSFPDAIPTLLANAVFESEGLSGRTVRRLPALSLILYSNGTRCDIRTAIEALRMGIASEWQAKTEATMTMAEEQLSGTTQANGQ